MIGRIAASPSGTPPGGPNVVVFVTDDQNADDLRVMPNVRRLLGDRGVTFARNFTNFPLCCPSRATLLTGQYAHNHGVLDNHHPEGGYRKLDSSETLPVWLTEDGYRTAYLGKYMNGIAYTIAPGWQEWQVKGGETDYRYLDYVLNEDGTLVEHGDAPRDHIDTLLSRRAAGYVERSAGRRPFFLEVGYLAPHVRAGPDRDCGAQPAPRDEGAFAAEPLPDKPSFDHRDPRKPETVTKHAIRDDERAKIEARYRCRLESLQAVDRGVAEVVRALERSGELDDTYLFFTSDNGLLLGEHRIQGGKEQPYEEAIRVPLLMRGPRIPAGRTSDSLTVNADIAPTITQITGARPTLTMDGESLLPLARHPSRTVDRTVLIDGAAYTAVRTDDYLYVERESGERELYDLRRDPYELHNVAGQRRYASTQRRLARELYELRDCAGASCRS